MNDFIHKIGRDPRVDWAIIVFITLVLLISMAYGGYSAYISVDETLRLSPPVARTTRPAIDANTLSEAVRAADSDAALSAELVKGYSGPTDPSR